MELIQGADRSKWIAHSNHNVKCFSRGEIERITNKYRTIIGRGAFGEVYRGILEDKSAVAVKKFVHDVKENFAKELTVHREINHRNVVRLIGYCVEENALMLVTEYIPNGNLSDILHRNNMPIALDIRLRIAVECAEALAYMHSHMYTKVVHGDIKPANILIDGCFNAKISDFGISRLANTNETVYTENVIGSIGYMDPLFARDGCLTVKSDVYSFGVVLLELFCRKKATREDGRISVVNLFIECLATGVKQVIEMFDPEIVSQDNMVILDGVAKLAHECLRLERDKRPEMVDVAECLRMLRKHTHQDHGQQGVDPFAWVSKIKTEPPAEVTIPAKTSPPVLCRVFSFAEIKAATNNFNVSRQVGRFSVVFQGKIDGGTRTTKVAIKRCPTRSGVLDNASEFHTEIETMSKLRHRHLVPLIGYCSEKNERILVYDYMTRGSLYDHLYTKRILGQEPPLTWKQRLDICIGVARGLLYLHESQVIHRNLTLKNILLDEQWVAKITDIYLPKTRSSDPDYVRTGQITEKTDVYSFGVVLFRVLCALPYVDFIPSVQAKLENWVVQLTEGSLGQLVGSYPKGKNIPPYIKKFAETAAKCLPNRGVVRPSMADVLSDLEYALETLVRQV